MAEREGNRSVTENVPSICTTNNVRYLFLDKTWENTL